MHQCENKWHNSGTSRSNQRQRKKPLWAAFFKARLFAKQQDDVEQPVPTTVTASKSMGKKKTLWRASDLSRMSGRMQAMTVGREPPSTWTPLRGCERVRKTSEAVAQQRNRGRAGTDRRNERWRAVVSRALYMAREQSAWESRPPNRARMMRATAQKCNASSP